MNSLLNRRLRKALGEKYIQENNMDELIPKAENKYSKIVNDIKERKVDRLYNQNVKNKKAFSEVVKILQDMNK